MTIGRALLLLAVGLWLDRGLSPLLAVPVGGLTLAPWWLLAAVVWVAVRCRNHVSAGGAALSNHAQIRPPAAAALAGLAGAVADSLAGWGFVGPYAVGLLAAAGVVVVARRGVNATSVAGAALLTAAAGLTAAFFAAAAFAGRSLFGAGDTPVGGAAYLVRGLGDVALTVVAVAAVGGLTGCLRILRAR